MAADEKKKGDAGEATEADGGKKKGKMKPLMIVAALMLGEGVAIFGLMSFLSPAPEPTMADEDASLMEDPFQFDADVEVELCEVQAFNRKEGRMFVYDVTLVVMVSSEDADTIRRFSEARAASIRDRIQHVIRRADPVQLNDPSLKVLKQQFMFEMNNLLGGKEIIKDVLISKLLQSPTNL
jgi:flagellar basal body-associated protein FliL